MSAYGLKNVNHGEPTALGGWIQQSPPRPYPGERLFAVVVVALIVGVVIWIARAV